MHLIQKQHSASHYAAAEDDDLWNKHRDQIGQSQAEIARLTRYRALRPHVPLLGKFANCLGVQRSGARLFRRHTAFEPFSQCWPRAHRLPTAAEPALTKRARRIDQVMANLRMKVIHTAIDFAVEHDADADSGAHRDVNQSFLAASSAPTGFAKSSSVSVIFHRHWNLENLLQVQNRVLTFPLRKEIYVAEFAGKRMYGARRTNSNSCDLFVSMRRDFAQHGHDAIQKLRVSALGIRGQLLFRLNSPIFIHHAYGDFGSANVDASNHDVLAMFFGFIASIRRSHLRKAQGQSSTSSRSRSGPRCPRAKPLSCCAASVSKQRLRAAKCRCDSLARDIRADRRRVLTFHRRLIRTKFGRDARPIAKCAVNAMRLLGFIENRGHTRHIMFERISAQQRFPGTDSVRDQRWMTLPVDRNYFP